MAAIRGRSHRRIRFDTYLARGRPGDEGEDVILITNNEGASGVAAAVERLARGEPGLDAIEAGIRRVEADESVRTVGKGGWPNLIGEVELDAGVMDGATLRTGAVGALRGFAHPVSVARAVMERLPHELLVGEGAARFAREIGATETELLVEETRAGWRAWFEREVSPADRARWPQAPLVDLCRHTVDPETRRDTTVFIARDGKGNIVAGTSTSGWGWKYPGRLGDSPIAGAGFYADRRYGACACTGAGEMTMRAGTARAVVAYLKMGLALDAAVSEAVEDLRALEGGLINRVTIHAIDAAGAHRVVAVNGRDNTYWRWQAGDPAPRSVSAETVRIG